MPRARWYIYIILSAGLFGMKIARLVSVLLLALALLANVALAATVKLKDGTVLEGEVKKMGGSFSVKTKDGALKLIPANDIQSIDDPTGKVSLGGSTPSGGGSSAPATGGGFNTPDFDTVARAAERSDNPIVAMTFWQKYIEENPKAPDLKKAEAELKRWQDMAENGAEKIRGKWVTGDELKSLYKQVDKLMLEALQLMANNQTLKSIEKLQEVIKIYPNSFEAHFELGFFYLLKGGNTQYDKAISSLESACKLRPNSPEALTNLAIAYNFRKNYEKSVTTAYKAAQIEDSKLIVQNLVNALSYAPPGMRANNPRVRPIMEEAPLLMAKHGISGPANQWFYVRPKPGARAGGGSDAPPGQRGIVGSGTGFFITSSGYIMTNRHVAAGGDQLIVRMSDGTQKVAEKIHLDDKQDIAILRIKSDKPTPFIRLAGYDAPPIGTDVTVLGFPLGAMLGQHVKITRGVVTSYETNQADCDVIVDAQVNPGNSGGPMIDKYGNVLALVAMKTFSDEAISSYGLGISTGRLRRYFEEQKALFADLKLEPAEKGTAILSTEDIAGQHAKSTVMILIVSGDLPAELKD